MAGSRGLGFYATYFMDVVPTSIESPFSEKRLNSYIYSGSH